MKKNIAIVAVASIATFATTTQSCVAIATSSVGLAVIKQILLGGVTKGMNIFKDKNSFLGNALIEQALPSQLKSLNNTLVNLGMQNLVNKEKQYIAEAAAFTVDVSQPILVNAINGLTSNDVARIAQGGNGIATQVLREKTESQLIAAIAPRVDEKLNQFGIVKTINQAMKGTSLLSGLFGGNNATAANAPSSLSKFASEQMVNGLFYIIQNHEEQNKNSIINGLKSIN